MPSNINIGFNPRKGNYVMTDLNDQVVAEFRVTAGSVVEAMAGRFKDFHLLLLHSTGKRTGRRYVTPLLYIQDGDRYIVVGSNAGADNEPAWVANVAAMAEVGIEVSGQILTAKPTILREGAEWNRLHAAMVAYSPDVLEYQTRTTRRFPLIVLDPVVSSPITR